MGNQLGWVQVSKALSAGHGGARRGGWSDDEGPARWPHRGPRAGRRRLRQVFRSAGALVVLAVVAATVVSWAA
jgi:hypothetical protein